MKTIMKRALVALMVLMVMTGAVLPAALAAETNAVSNVKTVSIYCGTKSVVVLYNSAGEVLNNSDFRWKSSNSKVVSVDSSGVVWGKKANASATITATNKHNSKNKVSIKYKVKKNKVDNLQSRPSSSAVAYGNWGLFTKSIEIASTNQVIVEYYLVCNFPSNWKCNKLHYITDYIDIYDRATQGYFSWLVSGRAAKISGFKKYWGRSVQVIKVTYSGARVGTTNIKATDWAYRVNPQGKLNIVYK